MKNDRSTCLGPRGRWKSIFSSLRGQSDFFKGLVSQRTRREEEDRESTGGRTGLGATRTALRPSGERTATPGSRPGTVRYRRKGGNLWGEKGVLCHSAGSSQKHQKQAQNKILSTRGSAKNQGKKKGGPKQHSTKNW